MCLLDLFKLHVTQKSFNKSKSYKSFDKITSVPRISQHYPEFLLLKVGEDSLETLSTTVPDSSGGFGVLNCSKFHNGPGTDERLVKRTISRFF